MKQTKLWTKDILINCISNYSTNDYFNLHPSNFTSLLGSFYEIFNDFIILFMILEPHVLVWFDVISPAKYDSHTTSPSPQSHGICLCCVYWCLFVNIYQQQRTDRSITRSCSQILFSTGIIRNCFFCSFWAQGVNLCYKLSL